MIRIMNLLFILSVSAVLGEMVLRRTWVEEGISGSPIQAVEEKKFLETLKNGTRSGEPVEGGVQIITRANCQPCTALRTWLQTNHVPYNEHNADDLGNKDIRGEIGLPRADFPMVYINRRLVGGYREAMTDPELLKMSVLGTGR